MRKIRKTIALFFWIAPNALGASATDTCLDKADFVPPEIIVVGEDDHISKECKDLRSGVGQAAADGKLEMATEIRPDGMGPLFALGADARAAQKVPGNVFGLEGDLYPLSNSLLAVMLIPATVVPVRPPPRTGTIRGTEDQDETVRYRNVVLFEKIVMEFLRAEQSPFHGRDFLHAVLLQSVAQGRQGALSREFSRGVLESMSEFPECETYLVACAKKVLENLLGNFRPELFNPNELGRDLESIQRLLHNALVRRANQSIPGPMKVAELKNFPDARGRKALVDGFSQEMALPLADRLHAKLDVMRVDTLRTLQMVKAVSPLLCKAKDDGLPLVIMAGYGHTRDFRELLPKINPKLAVPDFPSCAEGAKKLKERGLLPASLPPAAETKEGAGVPGVKPAE